LAVALAGGDQLAVKDALPTVERVSDAGELGKRRGCRCGLGMYGLSRRRQWLQGLSTRPISPRTPSGRRRAEGGRSWRASARTQEPQNSLRGFQTLNRPYVSGRWSASPTAALASSSTLLTHHGAALLRAWRTSQVGRDGQRFATGAGSKAAWRRLPRVQSSYGRRGQGVPPHALLYQHEPTDAYSQIESARAHLAFPSPTGQPAFMDLQLLTMLRD
jgi:hypothetical protein